MANESTHVEDLYYEDDILVARMQKVEDGVGFPHLDLKVPLTPTVYKRILIAASCYYALLKERGLKYLAAQVPNPSKSFVERLGFDEWEVPNMHIPNLMVKEL